MGMDKERRIPDLSTTILINTIIMIISLIIIISVITIIVIMCIGIIIIIVITILEYHLERGSLFRGIVSLEISVVNNSPI